MSNSTAMPVPEDTLCFDPDGLVSAAVQDAGSGTLLMVGWMNADAVERTRDTGLVHFYSRSRDRLWQKGESSGHILRVGSWPFSVSHAPFPAGYSIVLADSKVKAAKQEGARDRFNEPIASYVVGLQMLRNFCRLCGMEPKE